MTPIEKVARRLAALNGVSDLDAVCFQQPIQFNSYLGGLIVVPKEVKPAWQWYVPAAKAAIEALRDPSEVMLNAMKFNGYSQTANFKTIPPNQSIRVTPLWQAGIDAALKEE